MASPNDYEKFQQQVFDQLDDLEEADRQHMIADFIRAGQRCGVDVIKEIVDNGRPASEVIAEVRQKTNDAEGKQP